MEQSLIISAIILAAGRSSRYERGNKLLDLYRGKPIIQWVVEAAVNSKVDRTVVVLGFEKEKIQEILGSFSYIPVVNEDFEIGMSSSVKKGVENEKEVADAILIQPGDMPFVSSYDFNAVIDVYISKGHQIVIPKHKDRKGHPVLFDRELFPSILKISEETHGLKHVLRKFESSIHKIRVSSPGILKDIDTVNDLTND